MILNLQLISFDLAMISLICTRFVDSEELFRDLTIYDWF